MTKIIPVPAPESYGVTFSLSETRLRQLYDLAHPKDAPCMLPAQTLLQKHKDVLERSIIEAIAIDFDLYYEFQDAPQKPMPAPEDVTITYRLLPVWRGQAKLR
jgi:hypothetical protein